MTQPRWSAAGVGERFTSGQRDVLAVGDDVYAIDVADAHVYDEKGDGPGGAVVLLVRRVTSSR